MTATIRELVTEYNQAFGEGRLDRVAELLHPDLVFGGATAAEIRGAAPYVAALRKLAPVVVRNDIRRSLWTETRRSSCTTSSPTPRPAPC